LLRRSRVFLRHSGFDIRSSFELRDSVLPSLILLIDNYDSFVFNLARYIERLGQRTMIVRNDAVDPAGVRALKPRAVVISPGPCTPTEAGNSLEIVRNLHDDLPMLGVCLGHQAIGQAFGGRIVRAAEPVHGRSSQVYHDGSGLFAGLASPTTACRYHSLVIDRGSLADELSVTATLDDGTIMAIEHRELPVFGVQFHPESVLTRDGYRFLSNFLTLAGCDVPVNIDTLRTEMPFQQAPYSPPLAPVTF
jgi:anthranilate synthase/aminodeoxychorismate synthase-like glutamine amidotransferase